MLKFGLAYLSTAVVFAVMDFIWLSATAERLYRPLIGSLMADKVRLGPAVAFYLIYMGGTVFFAVWPALKSGSIATALIYGAVLGVVAYATYDLTNMATLKVWSMKITLIDLVWGAFATAMAAAAGTWITRSILKL